MVRNAVLVACDRLAWVILGLIVGALSAATVFSQAAQPPPAPAQQAVAAAPARVFTADAGLVLNFIKADKTKEFEAVIAKRWRKAQNRNGRNRRRPGECSNRPTPPSAAPRSTSTSSIRR
jgi:hypothetical protein